jgi:PPE-repeat protein
MPGADWGALPPEIIASQLMTGDGGASLAGAVAAYESLAAMLTSEGAAMAANAGGTAASGWEGMGGTAMLATAMPYIAALETLAAWVQQSAAGTAAILQAYLTARTTVIPVPACETNRIAQAEAVATNFLGFRTPEIIALDTEYFGHFWTQNASIAGSYEGIVMGILAELATPPPPAPLTANPAGPAAQAAALAEAVANGAANAGMHASMQGVNEAASGTQAGAQTAAAPAEAAQSLLSSAPQMLSQIPQMMGQFPQMLGQFPQMLGQFPQMAMGMLGPLASGMNASQAADAEVLDKASADLAPVTAGGDAARAGAGGSAGLGGGSAVMSSFTRPTSSFNAPGPPKLPTGWTAQTATSAPEVATSAQPAMAGGAGGLYGAPAPMGRDDRGRDGAAPVRTVQLTTAPGPGRGD